MTDHEIQSWSATAVRIFCAIDELDRKSFNARTDKLLGVLVIGYVELPILPFGCKICLYADCFTINIGELVRECTCFFGEDSIKTSAMFTELGQIMKVSKTCSEAPSVSYAAAYAGMAFSAFSETGSTAVPDSRRARMKLVCRDGWQHARSVGVSGKGQASSAGE